MGAKDQNDVPPRPVAEKPPVDNHAVMVLDNAYGERLKANGQAVDTWIDI